MRLPLLGESLRRGEFEMASGEMFLFGGLRARLERRGSIRPRTIPPKPIQGGVVFDIVSREGELVDRLQLPQGYSIAGFGKGKVVYLSMRDASGVHLARVRLR